jgi:hypothetical protein
LISGHCWSVSFRICQKLKTMMSRATSGALILILLQKPINT